MHIAAGTCFCANTSKSKRRAGMQLARFRRVRHKNSTVFRRNPGVILIRKAIANR